MIFQFLQVLRRRWFSSFLHHVAERWCIHLNTFQSPWTQRQQVPSKSRKKYTTRYTNTEDHHL